MNNPQTYRLGRLLHPPPLIAYNKFNPIPFLVIILSYYRFVRIILPPLAPPPRKGQGVLPHATAFCTPMHMIYLTQIPFLVDI